MATCDPGTVFAGFPYVDLGVWHGDDLDVPPIPPVPNAQSFYFVTTDATAMCNFVEDGYVYRASDNNCPGFCGQGAGTQSDLTPWPPVAGDHVFALGYAVNSAGDAFCPSCAVIPAAPAGYSIAGPPSADTSLGINDQPFTGRLEAYYTAHVIPLTLLLVTLFVGVFLLMTWGKRSAKAR